MIAAAFNPLTEIRSDARVRDRDGSQGSQDTGESGPAQQSDCRAHSLRLLSIAIYIAD